jgi:hypothetical protein
MARYFAGNTLAAFSRTLITTVEDTTAGWFDSAFVPNGIIVLQTGGGVLIARYNANATGSSWLHFEHRAGASVGSNTWVQLFNSAGVAVFRLQASGTIQAQYWNGSSWVNTGTAFSLPDPLNRYDLQFTPGTGGSFAFYTAGTLVASGSGFTVSGVTSDVREARFASWFGGGNNVFSQVLAADFDTRDSRYRMPTINANGALTDGTGGFADISETVLDDSTSIKLTAAAQRKSFTKTSITVPAGYRIGAMAVNARARVSGSITNGQAFTRVGSTNYDSANLGFNGGFEPRGNLWETNPATAADWTQSEFNAAEIGIEAV